MENRFRLGNEIRVEGEFTNALNALIDPDVVKLNILSPSGLLTKLTYPTGITKTSTGRYFSLIDGNFTGTWSYYWFSTGSGQAAEQKNFEILSVRAI